MSKYSFSCCDGLISDKSMKEMMDGNNNVLFTGNSKNSPSKGDNLDDSFDPKDETSLVSNSVSEDLSNLPSLEMRIYHEGNVHAPQTKGKIETYIITFNSILICLYFTDTKVIYKYREPKGTPTVLDMNKINELSTGDENNEDVCYEDKDKIVSVKKSLIDDYR